MKAYFASLALAFVTACASIPPLEYASNDASDSDGGSSDAAGESAADDATAEAASDAEGDAQVVDATASDATSDAACTLTGTTGVAACDSCIASNCCAPGNACFANAECVAIVKCAHDCATNAQPIACRADCRNQHPNGKKDYNGVATCVATACKTATCA